MAGSVALVTNCALHPLIHTFASGKSAQDVEKKKAERRTPHFIGLSQRYCRFFKIAEV
jgi:hypothetical protein